MNQTRSLRTLFRLSLRARSATVFALVAVGVAAAVIAAQAGQGQDQQKKEQPFRGHPKPIAAWSFAQADGTFVPDASDHGYDATIYGQPVLEALWHKQVALVF